MKNSLKRFICLTMALGITFGIAGCGGSGGNNSSTAGGNNFNKTILNVGVFNGGLGYHWAELVAEEFEKEYAKVSFEPGKVGVKVDINPQKNSFRPESVMAAIAQNTTAEDMYFNAFTSNVEYARGGYSMNITDWVEEKVYTANGELADMTYNPTTKKYELAAGAEAPVYSIADKMLFGNKEAFYLQESILDFNNDGTADIEAGYYSIPYDDSVTGFVYDYDLFQEQGWLNYDGIDGLPDNMEDFFNLLDRIVTAGMIPYTFATGVGEYISKALPVAFVGQYEGEEAAKLNYTYNGQYTFPADTFDAATVAEEGITVNADGTQTVTITPENAWMLAYQPSKEKYVEFTRKLFDTKYFDPDIYSGTHDYRAAQRDFVWSKLGKAGQARIAMLYEGEWWENEARSDFAQTGGYGKRDFRFFPLPEIEGQKDATVRSLGNYARGTDCFVNKKTTKAELCRLFLHYTHTEFALETFTMQSGSTRLYTYTLDNNQLSTMSKFAQNCYKMKKGVNSQVTIFNPHDASDQHAFYGYCPMGGYASDVLSTELGSFRNVAWNDQHLATVFARRAGQIGSMEGKLTAADFIEGMYEYYSKENWTNAYTEWQSLNN